MDELIFWQSGAERRALKLKPKRASERPTDTEKARARKETLDLFDPFESGFYEETIEMFPNNHTQGEKDG